MSLNPNEPDVEPVFFDATETDPEPSPGAAAQTVYGPGEDIPEPEPLQINGVPIETRESFRHWYAQKFRTANTLLSPFVGGRLKALDISDDDQALIDAADSLYDHAIKKEWVWLLKKGGGLMAVVEANGGLIFGIVTEARAEIEARIQAAEAAQADGGSVAGGGSEGAKSQADLDRAAKARPRDENGNIVY